MVIHNKPILEYAHTMAKPSPELSVSIRLAHTWTHCVRVTGQDNDYLIRICRPDTQYRQGDISDVTELSSISQGV